MMADAEDTAGSGLFMEERNCSVGVCSVQEFFPNAGGMITRNYIRYFN